MASRLSFARAFFATILLTCLVVPSYIPAIAADKMISGHALRQRSRAEGALEVFVSKSALRMSIVKTGWVLVAKAPWKELTMYCTHTHKYYKSPIGAFRNPYLKARNMYDGGAFADVAVARHGDGKVCGFKTRVFTERPGFEAAQLALRKNRLVAARAPKKFTYQTTDDFKCDPQVGFIISKFFVVPDQGGVPLMLTYTAVEEGDKIELETTTIKPATSSADNFDLPAGYAAVKDSMQVIVPDNNDGELDMMMFGSKEK